ncbi:MAG TPA: DinB family protein [Candidatus Limnocylindrales bacterium]|jgi:uncharacterized damage-inducible protein DinB
MTRSLLADEFDHHVWATLVVLDTLAPLSDQQLATAVPGLYGSILDTARHLVGADRWYLFTLTRGTVDQIEEASLDVAGLRAAMEPDAASWQAILATDPDPDEMFTLVREDGTKSHATWGVRLAQAVHHGTDHRSQICTALTTLGTQPPEIDVWDWALANGRHWDD